MTWHGGRVLFPMATLDAVARGDVTVAFRRWKRPTVKAGGTLTTRAGVLAIESVDVIEAADVSAEDAAAAGYPSPGDVLADLGDRDGLTYRIRFHVAGPDPRLALRERDDLTADEVVALTTRLGRLDARASGPWTDRYLALIGAREGVRAGDLADEVGAERLVFKTDVRKLKALGLTESLEVGYRLSPRGRAWLAR